MRRIIGLALGFYFRRIERFHRARAGDRAGAVRFQPSQFADGFIRDWRLGSAQSEFHRDGAVVLIQTGEMAPDPVRCDSRSIA